MRRFDGIVAGVAWGTLLGLVAAMGCAGSKRQSRDPAKCMHSCEQERCNYVPDGLGDNTEYLDCLGDCERRCGG
jgi:hypothetical protein